MPSGYTIEVTFLNFTLGPNQKSDCSEPAPGARVTITNVASNDERQPFQLCGQSIPQPVYSKGNFMQVTLTTPANVYSGFNASYRAIAANACKFSWWG